VLVGRRFGNRTLVDHCSGGRGSNRLVTRAFRFLKAGDRGRPGDLVLGKGRTAPASLR